MQIEETKKQVKWVKVRSLKKANWPTRDYIFYEEKIKMNFTEHYRTRNNKTLFYEHDHHWRNGTGFQKCHT